MNTLCRIARPYGIWVLEDRMLGSGVIDGDMVGKFKAVAGMAASELEGENTYMKTIKAEGVGVLKISGNVIGLALFYAITGMELELDEKLMILATGLKGKTYKIGDFKNTGVGGDLQGVLEEEAQEIIKRTGLTDEGLRKKILDTWEDKISKLDTAGLGEIIENPNPKDLIKKLRNFGSPPETLIKSKDPQGEKGGSVMNRTDPRWNKENRWIHKILEKDRDTDTKGDARESKKGTTFIQGLMEGDLEAMAKAARDLIPENVVKSWPREKDLMELKNNLKKYVPQDDTSLTACLAKVGEIIKVVETAYGITGVRSAGKIPENILRTNRESLKLTCDDLEAYDRNLWHGLRVNVIRHILENGKELTLMRDKAGGKDDLWRRIISELAPEYLIVGTKQDKIPYTKTGTDEAGNVNKDIFVKSMTTKDIILPAGANATIVSLAIKEVINEALKSKNKWTLSCTFNQAMPVMMAAHYIRASMGARKGTRAVCFSAKIAAIHAHFYIISRNVMIQGNMDTPGFVIEVEPGYKPEDDISKIGGKEPNICLEEIKEILEKEHTMTEWRACTTKKLKQWFEKCKIIIKKGVESGLNEVWSKALKREEKEKGKERSVSVRRNTQPLPEKGRSREREKEKTVEKREKSQNQRSESNKYRGKEQEGNYQRNWNKEDTRRDRDSSGKRGSWYGREGTDYRKGESDQTACRRRGGAGYNSNRGGRVTQPRDLEDRWKEEDTPPWERGGYSRGNNRGRRRNNRRGFW